MTTPSVTGRRERRRQKVLPGYVRGATNAAEYLGIDRRTFNQWRDDPEVGHNEFLKPRIIRGEAYYSIEKLDRFMDPKCNPPGAVIENNLSASQQ